MIRVGLYRSHCKNALYFYKSLHIHSHMYSEQNQRIATKVCEQESLTKIVNVVVQEQGSGVRTGPFSIDHIEKIHKLCT